MGAVPKLMGACQAQCFSLTVKLLVDHDLKHETHQPLFSILLE